MHAKTTSHSLDRVDVDLQQFKHRRPRLSMIWVKEFDGKRHHLVARWISQDA
ncbi:hypothetical protein H6G17_13305 [Chroococcidiopsis sp. FACHB-1243]|uniref:hypothetical protein n=1 Tax=Chroococcidiopsis sp. [FACHB-1243] TaxID=2692781 RepID=UPI00177AFDD9|nr:hypothetical protein [Chroococcidiopsis sp. [FACHB-1243]]MBD2306486.1 hypothetical protein [Chroococcidiopsis sp. [FACHB-1243]]